MYCPRCGSKNTAGTRSCAECTAPLGPRDGSAICHTCGASLSSADRYCWSCGKRTQESNGATEWVMPSLGDTGVASPPPWMASEQLTDERAPVDLRNQPEFATARSGEHTPSSPLDLPEWLRDESDPAGFDFDPPELELIEDDDLPAWIPELAKTETGVYDRPSPAQPAEAPEPAPAPLQRHPVVPPVSRAWLARPPVPEAPPAAMVIREPLADREDPLAASPGQSEPAVEPPVVSDVGPASEALASAGAAVVVEAVAPAVEEAEASAPQPELGDEAPEIAEAAGPAATSTASVFESLSLGKEVEMATAGSEGAPESEGERQNSRRTILIIGALVILAIIVVVILIYIFTLS